MIHFIQLFVILNLLLPKCFSVFPVFSGIITCVLILSCLPAFLLYRNSRRKQKILFQRKLADFELRALRAQVNPHFIFNSMNSIQYFILKNNRENAHRYLSKFSGLIRTVLDYSQKESVPVGEEIDALRLYLDLEALRFENHFDFAIEIDPEIDRENEQIPPMLIQPYVENAIWHGLMHKKEKGFIHIRLNKREDFYICVIEDNGIGRAKARELKDNNISGCSHGMNMTKRRLEILNRFYRAGIPSVRITDLKDASQSPLGTKVEITIPQFNFSHDQNSYCRR
jgi:LytS/YehU family sensor histidine kinase